MRDKPQISQIRGFRIYVMELLCFTKTCMTPVLKINIFGIRGYCNTIIIPTYLPTHPPNYQPTHIPIYLPA
jgi:hypothetical protein